MGGFPEGAEYCDKEGIEMDIDAGAMRSLS
jgi:hypothetical protein